MLFSSIPFIVFFLPVTLLGYYYCPGTKVRNYFLLAVSLLFYAWGEPKYVLVMLLSILINFRMGGLIGTVTYPLSQRRLILFAAIAINLLLLFYFKYFVFSERIINIFFRRIINQPQLYLPMAAIALPLGISFYTFQSISYLVDVYKKPELAQRNILELGLYIAFFPQLIAGPIVRYHDINEQIKKRGHSIALFAKGAERFIIGLSKKVLIANSMAAMADRILEMSLDTVPYHFLVLGIISYSLQIYYDFSGYSDMAIGLGKMFGFTIFENFDYPYSAKSMTEFWRRWHISLSSWFKDYLYIPLGGNRKGKTRTVINLFIVFFVTGLWHGASFNFIFWGLGHGILLFFEKIAGRKIQAKTPNRKILNFFGHIYTITAVVSLWIFFRLGMRRSYEFLRYIFAINPGNEGAAGLIMIYSDSRFVFYFIAGIVFAFPWWRKITPLYCASIAPPRYLALIVLLVLSISTLAVNAYNPFIYFRF